MRNAYKIVVGKLEMNWLLGKPGRENVDLIDLPQDEVSSRLL
jgi:hypothetical protein